LLCTLASALDRPPCAEQLVLRTEDGVRLHGVLYRAATPRKTALLLVHGFGGEFYGGYFTSLSQAAAREGYTTAAVNMRDHGGGAKTSDFTDNRPDLAAATAYLRQQGFTRLVLLGQSMGTNRVLFYQAATADPNIAATVLIAGPGDLFEWNVRQLGRDKAQATVDEALKLRAAGRDGELMLIEMGPLGKQLYTPQYLLSMRGPQRKSNPYENIARVKNRVLIIRGTADKTVPADIAQRLQKSANPASRAEVIEIQGAAHGFAGHEAQVADAVLGWLKKVAP
jgi:pimeloyl-ACP methyl ester carboxylesterase